MSSSGDLAPNQLMMAQRVNVHDVSIRRVGDVGEISPSSEAPASTRHCAQPNSLQAWSSPETRSANFLPNPDRFASRERTSE